MRDASRWCAVHSQRATRARELKQEQESISWHHCLSLNRPLGDGRVDFGHEADGFAKGRNDLAVVHLIVVGQRAGTPVFEPLLANLLPSLTFSWQR